MEGFFMKIKAMFLAVFFISSLFFCIPQKADAEILWVSVEVVRLNQTDARLAFWGNEINGAFTNKSFWIDSNHPKQKEFLAILLTAISIGENLRIRMDTVTSEVTVIGTFPN
jgi:DNA phosphorothioation-dependent restriction protein DptG